MSNETVAPSKWRPTPSPLTREYDAMLASVALGNPHRLDAYDLAYRLNRAGCMVYSDILLNKARLI